jgi:Transposase DDE domain group 1
VDGSVADNLASTRASLSPIGPDAVRPLANQLRLVLHTAPYWLTLTVRDAIPQPQPRASAEFATLRARLLKIAARDRRACAHRLRRRLSRGRGVCPATAKFQQPSNAALARLQIVHRHDANAHRRRSDHPMGVDSRIDQVRT